MATNTSKPLTKRIIFLLAAAILYLMIPQNATMPMPEEAVFPFSLLSLSQIARVFAFRQWIATDQLHDDQHCCKKNQIHGNVMIR